MSMARAATMMMAAVCIQSSGCARDAAIGERSAPASNASSLANTSSVAVASPLPAAPTASAVPSAARKTKAPLRIEVPPDAEVATFLRVERGRAIREGRTVLVEVGAGWCPPCRTLKAAIARADLDETLDGVTLIAFDADVHGARLDSLGYQSKFIPYFAIPKPDGRASDVQLDVKIPKDATAAQIGAALRPLVDAARRDAGGG